MYCAASNAYKVAKEFFSILLLIFDYLFALEPTLVNVPTPAIIVHDALLKNIIFSSIPAHTLASGHFNVKFVANNSQH